MKTIFTLLFMSLYVAVFGYNWTIYGPAGIHANNILFGAGSHGYDVICTDNGLCVNNGPANSWHTYYYSLPALEAVPYDTNHVLVVMGNGSFGDAIFKFNLSTNTYEVVEWSYLPTFIRYCTSNNTYYVGTRYDGLICSADGITWGNVPYFQNKASAAMDFYGQHIVVTQENNIYATYYSDDGGITWNQSSSNIPIHDIAFDANGILYGVFTGISNSSGLYFSNDFGHTWNMEYYIDNMNTVGFDVLGEIFTGFHGAVAPFEGVAIYDTTANNFIFFNAGLPNKNIQKFKINPILSSITIFACTDTGVYYCNDYFTSVYDNYFAGTDVSIYPNPANETINISVQQKSQIEILNIEGQIIKSINANEYHTTIDISALSRGVYFLKFRTDNGIIVKKFIKQ